MSLICVPAVTGLVARARSQSCMDLFVYTDWNWKLWKLRKSLQTLIQPLYTSFCCFVLSFVCLFCSGGFLLFVSFVLQYRLNNATVHWIRKLLTAIHKPSAKWSIERWQRHTAGGGFHQIHLQKLSFFALSLTVPHSAALYARSFQFQILQSIYKQIACKYFFCMSSN